MTSEVLDGPMPAPPSTGSLTRMPGLDGVRAVAVAAVLLFHANPSWLPGGFLGVDVFFTLSGFLITSLLLTELEARGGLRFGRFYQHRAKRLLPAMFLVLIATSLLAITVAQDAATRVREDAIASAAYVTNWWYVAHDTSYFATIGRPPLLQHLWSLAVEEQFYLVWPLILYVLWRIGRVEAVRVGAMIGVLASTAWMGWIAVRDDIPAVADSGRVYFGTDTHAMTLLVGAVLATYWTQAGAIDALTRRGRAVVSLLGAACLAGLVLVFRSVDESSWVLYRSGFLWIGLLTAGFVAAAAVNDTLFSRALSTQPLRWIGQRSYGIYLWHWPIFLVLRPGVDLDATGWQVQAARFALTLAAAELSYRLVEMPIRRGAIGRLWGRWRDSSGLGHATRVGLTALTTAGLVFALGLGLGLAQEPTLQDALGGVTSVGAGSLSAAPSTGAADSGAGAAVGEKGSEAPPPPAPTPKDPTPAAKPKPKPSPKPSKTRKPAAPSKTRAPATASGNARLSTTAVGDSVLLGSQSALNAALPKVTVDAQVSRMPGEIFSRVRERKRLGRLGDVVVIQAGTNGVIGSSELTSLLTLLKDRKRVILVTPHGDRAWIRQSQSVIRRAGERFGNGNVRVADWDTFATQHRRLLFKDGIHPLPGAGTTAYARLIKEAITR